MRAGDQHSHHARIFIRLREFQRNKPLRPHVSGVIALLKEARSSFKTSEIHAILVNTTDWALLVDGQTRQSAWDEQGGWGMLNALTAVAQRNRIVTGILDDPDDVATYYLTSVPANDAVVITGVWERSMTDEDTPVVDSNDYPSPANLDIILQKKPPGGSWSDAVTTAGTYAPHDGNPEDNVRQVRYTQQGQGAELEFRVKVKHNPTQDTPFEGAQTFSLASRHAFQ